MIRPPTRPTRPAARGWKYASLKGIGGVLLAGAALTAAFIGARLARTSAEDGPRFLRTAEQNVLLITIDTLRADALGSYGGRAATPNLDRLASNGLRFTFAHAHAVVTLPSHASILTGRYPFEHGVRDNAGFRLDSKPETLAEMARAKGFATAAFVGAFPLNRQFGLARGFQVYDDVSGREVAPSDFAFSERRADEVVTNARAWIDRQSTPWFAWVHVFDPHSPYAPPPPFDREYGDFPYAGEIAYTDRALAPLLDAARQGSRPTLVIVTGDHGEGLGEHGELTHGVFAYESTLRVPLIVAQVGASVVPPPSPAVSDRPVGHIDIAPTIADAVGLSLPDGLPGHSLLAPTSDDRATYFEAMTPMLKRGWAPLTGVVAGHDKYVDLPVEELYDLAADPLELHNLAETQPGDRVRALSARLKDFGDTTPGAARAENADARARLQSLGYLSGSAPRKAVYRDDDDPKRLIDLDRLMMGGIALHREGRSGEAEDAYRAVIARRPDMMLAYRRLAFLLWERGAADEAIATLREAVARNGADAETETRLGTYLVERGVLVEGLAMLERAARANPDDADTQNALGIAYGHAGRHADALRMFEAVLARDPHDAFALENAATVQLARGDLRAAGEAFSRAASNDPRSSRAEAGLGVVAAKSGRQAEAIDHWRRAVSLDPSNYDALYNLATALAGAGRMPEARPYLEQFVRTAPRGFYARDIEEIERALGRVK